MLQQSVLEFIARREIHVTAFGGGDYIFLAVPEQAGASKTGTSGDQRGVSSFQMTFVQSGEFTDLELGDPVSGGFQIVEQRDRRQPEERSQARCLNQPWQVRSN